MGNKNCQKQKDNLQTLKRQLGFWDSVAINVGVVIGVGIFRTPGNVAQHLGSAPWILLAWSLGAVIALLGVLCYAELSSCYPHTGGTYVYLREAFGKPAAFLFGWAEFAILRAGSIAGVAYIFSDYFLKLVPVHFGAGTEKIFAISAIAVFTAVNIAGLHVGTRVQHILTSLKVISILIIASAIFGFKGLGHLHFHENINSGSHFAGLAPALIPVLWTYGGWHQSTFMSGEFKDTEKALPLSLITGIFIVAAVYLLINTAYLAVFTPAQMIETRTIASDVFVQLLGRAGGVIVTGVVLISASGALNSTILTGARIPFAVAHDMPRIRWMGTIHPQLGTPLRCFVINAVWASALVFWGNFETLLFFFGFANWLFFALVGFSVFRLRQKAISSKAFSMLGYPWVPLLFILSSLWLCLTTVQHAPRESLLGALLLLAGIPIYFLFREKPTARS